MTERLHASINPVPETPDTETSPNYVTIGRRLAVPPFVLMQALQELLTARGHDANALDGWRAATYQIPYERRVRVRRQCEKYGIDYGDTIEEQIAAANALLVALTSRGVLTANRHDIVIVPGDRLRPQYNPQTQKPRPLLMVHVPPTMGLRQEINDLRSAGFVNSRARPGSYDLAVKLPIPAHLRAEVGELILDPTVDLPMPSEIALGPVEPLV